MTCNKTKTNIFALLKTELKTGISLKINQLKSIFPVFNWLPNYQKSWLKGDIQTGITVGIMLIPQGMAYASLAGLPPVYGLYTSIFPLIIYAVFGTSYQLSVGPVALLSLLTASALSSIPNLTPEQYISYAILISFLAGTIQFLLGLFRIGFLVNFLSRPVISGFTSAAALIIMVSQLKHFLGVSFKNQENIFQILIQLFQKLSELNWVALLIGTIGVLIILGIRKWKKTYPGQLLAMIFGIVAVVLFQLFEGNHAVNILREIPNNLPKIQFLSLDTSLIKSFLPISFTVALVSFMESIAVGKSIEIKRKNYKIDANKELIALGLAKVFGSFFQSYANTGGFSRSAINDQSGANTPLAGVISAIVVFLTLLFLTPFFYYLPHAILASVIVIAAISLIDLQEPVQLWKSNPFDFSMLLITFLATLIFGVQIGIGVGVFLSLALVLFSTTYPHTAVLAKIPNTHYYRNIERFKDLEQKDTILIYRFDAQLFFANINHFKDKLYEYENSKGNKLQLLIIDGESINNIDSTSINALDEIISDHRSRNIKVFFTGVKGPVRDKMVSSGFMERVGTSHFFMSIHEAVECFETQCMETEKKDQFQEFISQSKFK